MQHYIDIADKNGVALLGNGSCQFCGAQTTKGIHECLEIFNLGFKQLDYAKEYNHLYRFLSVDAHALQHSEIHGRWSNHFHLTRLHLIFRYKVQWTYSLSPKLSNHLNAYKKNRLHEFLTPPALLQRGNITTIEILTGSKTETDCQEMILNWSKEVYKAWSTYHELVDVIAKGFIRETL